MRLAAILLLLFALPCTAHAAERWRATQVSKPEVPPEIFAQDMAPAPSGIANMLTATGPEEGGIVRAWYSQPTRRYRHGILGDNTEGGALVVQRTDGRTFTYRLDEIEVFEDLYPRIADLDGDGRSEVVTIRSSLLAGAAITIFGLNGDTLVRKASTRFIGKPFRWLNIAGIARFTGASTPEIAFVVTPHIGGKLALARYAGGKIETSGTLNGFSNHVIGSTELRLSAVADFDGDGRMDLALPSADRRQLRVMRFAKGRVDALAVASLPSPIDKAIAVTGSGPSAQLTVGAENGAVYEVGR